MLPLAVDFGFEYVDDYVHWALFTCIAHNAYLPRRDGPFWLLYRRMVYEALMLNAFCVARRSALYIASHSIVWPTFWMTLPALLYVPS